MQFQFRLTDREFARSLKLNRTAAPMQWKHFALIICCLLPSIALAMVFSFKLTLAWFTLTTIIMIVYAVMAFARQTGRVESYDQEMEFTDEILGNRFSHSQSQIRWYLIDEIEETTDAFIIRRLQRYSLIPKRVLGDQVQQCRDFFAQLKSSPRQYEEPLTLYQELFASPSPFAVKCFYYQPDDLQKAIRSKFRLVNLSDPSDQTSKSVGWAGVLTVFVTLGVVLGLLMPLLMGDRVFTTGEAAQLAVVWLLPLLLLWGYVKIAQWINRRRPGEVPKDQCESRLTINGWAVGHPDAVTLFDWQDVQAFYESEDFLAIKTINQLLHLIPKRIFTETGEAESFLSQALDLKRQSDRDIAIPIADIVESGNPYQSPIR